MVGQFKLIVISIDKESIWRNYPTRIFSVPVRANFKGAFCTSNVHIHATVKIIFFRVSLAVYNGSRRVREPSSNGCIFSIS